MEKNIYTIDEIRQVMLKLSEKYDIQNAYLFGSYARGEATESSDIDILIKGGEKFKASNIFSLGEDIRSNTHKPVDIFEVRELNQGTPFYNQVEKEQVMLV